MIWASRKQGAPSASAATIVKRIIHMEHPMALDGAISSSGVTDTDLDRMINSILDSELKITVDAIVHTTASTDGD
jgi:hypothetical protein